jgi:N-acetylglucosamine-6-phosphate deacetylase
LTTLAGLVLGPDGTLRPGAVEMDGKVVGTVEPARRPARAAERIVAPGFVDLQVNGHDDVDVARAEGSDWDRLAELMLAQGVTAWCPTLVTAAPDTYPPALARISSGARRPGPRPAVLGAHLEGPFLGSFPGAHDRSHLATRIGPSERAWLAGLGPTVRVVTLAPELEGALDATRELSARGVTVSCGHSAATWEEARAAADAGAALVTHLYNGMAPLHHRQPGLVGAALTDPRLTPSLIADGIHVHPAALAAAFGARAGLSGRPGDPGVVLVTDAVAWRTGQVGGVGVLRSGSDAPRRPDGTIAGSALAMDRAVATVVAAGVAPASALAAASLVPARVIGDATRGRLEPGARADAVVLDAELAVVETWMDGRLVWQR